KGGDLVAYKKQEENTYLVVDPSSSGGFLEGLPDGHYMANGIGDYDTSPPISLMTDKFTAFKKFNGIWNIDYQSDSIYTSKLSMDGAFRSTFDNQSSSEPVLLQNGTK